MAGHDMGSIARILGVSNLTVRKVLEGRHWSQLNLPPKETPKIDLERVQLLRAVGVPYQEIAKLLGVSYQMLLKVYRVQHWTQRRGEAAPPESGKSSGQSPE